jgi:arsenite methyltransferase
MVRWSPSRDEEADMGEPSIHPFDAEAAVRERYAAAARRNEPSLCCAVAYDPRLLEAIPREVVERDYGCGDPSRFVREGDRVLDLGSGGGKICFLAAQIAGPRGAVLGIDMNEEMLDLARGAAPVVGERLGYANVRFARARIQDLALDLDWLDARLAGAPVSDLAGFARLEREIQLRRDEAPLVPDASVDLVLSNCVLNLVRDEDKGALFREIHRVLRPEGRVALSDIVSDEPVPAHLKDDPALWSGCVSGAFQERELLGGLEAAGFHGVRIERWEPEPFAVVEGIEFRAVTVTAVKPRRDPCLEAHQAVIYRGPWLRVEDDDGHVLTRGERLAVCARTFDALTTGPWADHVIGVAPRVPVPEGERQPFDCARTAPRDPRETKGGGGARTVAGCDPGSGCCG